MASYQRQKTALRGALYAFVAGAHYITEEVEKRQALKPGGDDPEVVESRQIMIEADYERLLQSSQSGDLLADILGEDDLYPFGVDWPGEAFTLLLSKLIAPKLSLTSESESMEEDFEPRFRFRKGFKELLSAIAASLESSKSNRGATDHWMVLLLNSAFHAGMTIACRNAENPKLYYAEVSSVEEETDPWTRYPQISAALDRQLERESRRRTGLVSDLDY